MAVTLPGILRAIVRAERALLNDPAWVAEALKVIEDLEAAAAGHAPAEETPAEPGEGGAG